MRFLDDPKGETGGIRAGWADRVSLDTLIRISRKLWDRSEKTSLEFLDACSRLPAFLENHDFFQWARLGEAFLEGPSGNIALCRAFFQSSPALVASEAPHRMGLWADKALQIARSSQMAALRYLRSTPAFLGYGAPIDLGRWGDMALEILSSEGAGEETAVSFLLSSPFVLEHIPFKELSDWKSLGMLMAASSSWLARDFFSFVPADLGSLDRLERIRIYELCHGLAQEAPGLAGAFFHRCPKRLLRLNPAVRIGVLEETATLSRGQPAGIPAVFDEITRALWGLPYPTQRTVMEQGAMVAEISVEASRAYFQNLGRILEAIHDTFLPLWVRSGIGLLKEDGRRGVQFFNLSSGESLKTLSKWRAAARLDDYRHILAFVAQAIAGKQMTLRDLEALAADQNRPARIYPTGDGRAIYLPSFVAEQETKRDNYRIYKLSAAHQAGHVAFGTFELELSWILAALEGLPHKDLALDIFFILEDGRIDHRLGREYRGLRRDLDLAAGAWIRRRPPLRDLPALEALMEILLRTTMGVPSDEWVPPEISVQAEFLKETVSGFCESARGVSDCFHKALEIYRYLRPLAANGSYTPCETVPFRGRIDPELLPGPGQLSLSALDGNEEDAAPRMSRDELMSRLQTLSDPSHLKLLRGRVDASRGLYITETAAERARAGEGDQASDASGAAGLPLFPPPRGSVLHRGPFYYNEWDYLQRNYRARWCCLREKPLETMNPERIDEIRAEYRDLILKVRHQFQRIRPDLLEITRRVEWGDEIDLSALIQRVVDRKGGQSPSDRIFTRRERRIRRISTLLLLDMSASTDEIVPESGPQGIEAPPGRERRIIDIETESLVVIMEALDVLDDEYAVYGFSGSGRHHVDFYLIKDFSEPYSDILKGRISGIRPRQSTRMGTAIRHAVARMKPLETDQRLLILLSDGFPQDIDYGEDRRSNEYALQDTAMALKEAKMEGIQPFCITVDRAGHDYLRKMCKPSEYLVIADVRALPTALPNIVESLLV